MPAYKCERAEEDVLALQQDDVCILGFTYRYGLRRQNPVRS